MSPEDVRQLGRLGRASEAVGENWGSLAQPPRLGEHLSTRLAELIGRGEFDDEGRLPSELVLTNRFGVSRPVVREALSHLRSMGFIVSGKGSGSCTRRDNHHTHRSPCCQTRCSDSEARLTQDFRRGFEWQQANVVQAQRPPARSVV